MAMPTGERASRAQSAPLVCDGNDDANAFAASSRAAMAQ